MKLTEYTVINRALPEGLVFALVSDLHGCDPRGAIALVKRISPDYILAPGDIFEVMDGSRDRENEAGYLLLSECAKIAPTFFSPGNHEVGAIHSSSPKWKRLEKKGKEISNNDRKRLDETGAVFLDNSFVIRDGIAFGGLGTGLIYDKAMPKISLLNGFFKSSCPKILLCHHPEYFKKHFESTDVDLIVSGHAHGGQWRFFGRGVFAPGQGLFPKYTSGVYEERLVISRGLKKGGSVPRIFNPTEVVKIKIEH